VIPTRLALQEINSTFVANDAIFGEDPAHQVILVISSFVPGPDLQLTDLTEATFPGYSEITVPAPPQLAILDNDTGRFGAVLKEPVGGYKWVCTAAPDPSQVVYGWALADSDGNLWFTELLPEPITISDVGNFVELTAVVGYLSLEAYGNIDGGE